MQAKKVITFYYPKCPPISFTNLILKHNFSAAAKCLVAVIVTRHKIITTISPALITRVKERKENVKADIFHVYQALLWVSQDGGGGGARAAGSGRQHREGSLSADEGEVYQDPS